MIWLIHMKGLIKYKVIDKLQNKNKIIHKVKAKMNSDKDEAKRCSVPIEGLPELGINIVKSDIRAASRMGPLQKGVSQLWLKGHNTDYSGHMCKKTIQTEKTT